MMATTAGLAGFTDNLDDICFYKPHKNISRWFIMTYKKE